MLLYVIERRLHKLGNGEREYRNRAGWGLGIVQKCFVFTLINV